MNGCFAIVPALIIHYSNLVLGTVRFMGAEASNRLSFLIMLVLLNRAFENCGCSQNLYRPGVTMCNCDPNDSSCF